jgi:hypothetical protein
LKHEIRKNKNLIDKNFKLIKTMSEKIHTNLIMTEMLISNDESKHDENCHGVLVVETIGKVVIAGRRAEETQQRDSPR